MTTFASNELQPGTVGRPDLRRVDIHCHCLPGIDDGPPNADEALALCRLLVHDGVTDVIATPHQLGRYEGGNRASSVRSSATQLQQLLEQARVPLKIHAGGEVRVDERIPQLLEQDEILTLADRRRHLLLELSFSSYIEPEGLLNYLSGTQMSIILAHAERYSTLQRDPAAAEKWLAGGAVLQVNADSIIGAAGKPAANAALDWLSRGWVALVATDAHGASRRPRMADALNMLRDRFGEDTANRVCIRNPLCVLEGRALGTEGNHHATP